MGGELQNLGDHVYSDVRNDLQSARRPEDYRTITKGVADRGDALFEDALAASGATIACRSGCFFCCYIKVDVLPHELFRMTDFVRKNFSGDQVADLLRLARANAERIAKMSFLEQMATNMACPLLKDGKCSVYGVRPSLCRNYHSRTVESCSYSYEHPQDLYSPDESIPQIKKTTGVCHEAAKAGFSDEGYDCRAYNLSAALVEALENPSCEKRWRDKKTAFSKSALAKEPSPEDLPSGEFE